MAEMKYSDCIITDAEEYPPEVRQRIESGYMKAMAEHLPLNIPMIG